MLIANFFVNLLGIFLFLFIFWRRLKEDYASEIVFRTASYVLLLISFAYLFSFNFLKDWFLWFGFFGGVLGLMLSSYSQRVRFFESLESFVVAMLPWLSLLFLKDSIRTSSFISFVAFVLTLIIMFVSYWLSANYKSFFWYKSGKVGFTGLIVLAIIFIIRSIVAFFEIPVLSLIGNWEMYLSGVSLLIVIILIYRLGKTT